MDITSLIAQTEETIAALDLDPNDSRSVGRFEKLSKLWLQLRKQKAREEEKKKPTILDDLEV